VPNFWLGSMLVLALALHLRWLPATGYANPLEAPWDGLRHAILPTLTLGASAVAEITRQLRSALQDTLNTDYVRTARAKGIAERGVLWKHALRNALIPMISVSGLTISRLVGPRSRASCARRSRTRSTRTTCARRAPRGSPSAG